jgi:flagellin
MSLRINHNIAALNAHRNLTNTTNELSKSMEKLSSGYRINRASDDPAGLVISEQFRAQVAGLNRAISNSEGSINMIQTAEGALNEMNSLLVSMRELAIHAANEGFNDANQLAADQAEIENALKTIDRIATNTQFGTKKLLDGTKENLATISTANSSKLSILNSTLSSGTHSVTATKVSDASATLNTTSFGVSLNSTGTPTELTNGVHNVDVVQASDGAKKLSSSIRITDAFNNNLTLGTAGQYATLNSVSSFGTVAAATAGTYQVEMNYQGEDGVVAGNQVISVALASGDTVSDVVTKWNSAIAGNSSLSGKIEAATTSGAADGSARLVFRSTYKGAQYSVKLNSFSTASTGGSNLFAMGSARSNRGVSKDVLKLQIYTDRYGSKTKSIDISTVSGGNGEKTFSSLSALKDEVERALTIAEASGGFGTVAKSGEDSTIANVGAEVVGTDKLQLFTRDEGSDYSIKHLENSTSKEEAANILGLSVDTIAVAGTDALVSFDGYTNTITDVKYSTTSNETLYNAAAGTTGRGSLGVTLNTALNGINLGNMLLDVSAAKFNVRLDGGPGYSVTAGVDATIYNATRDESLKVNYALSSEGGSETINDTDRSLIFQIGGSVGQTARISLKNMSTSSLAKNVSGNMFSSLSAINVTTAAGAQDAQSLIDKAIDEVTEARGTLGSFQKNTLESNLTNLRVAAQNLTAAESDIRDTDMAGEMSNFVSKQILLQAGTAMLAQGNQAPQVVLSLFG